VASVPRWWNVGSPVFHDYSTACRNIDRSLVASTTLADMRACAAIPVPFGNRMGGVVDILDGLPNREVYWVASELISYYADLTQVDAGLTMMALASYREKRGHYPAQLAELVPESLPRSPIDYADRQTPRYRPGEGDYVPYSLGPDGIDDGGRVNGSSPRSYREKGDFVYSRTSRSNEGYVWVH
jgi:hypothetical protein